MNRLFGTLALVMLLGWASPAPAVTIDLTLDVDRLSSPGQVIYTVGVEEAGSAAGVSISGYTLDFEFDAFEFAFVSAQQLVSFGALGVLDFFALNDCSSGRCTAGLVPNQDSSPVGALFAITFDILANVEDGLADFRAGIIDLTFDDVSPATGQPVFDKGVSVVSDAAPEPAPVALLLLGTFGAFAYRRRMLSDSL